MYILNNVGHRDILVILLDLYFDSLLYYPFLFVYLKLILVAVKC